MIKAGLFIKEIAQIVFVCEKHFNSSGQKPSFESLRPFNQHFDDSSHCSKSRKFWKHWIFIELKKKARYWFFRCFDFITDFVHPMD